MSTPEELQAILDEANSRGSLIDRHPLILARQQSPESRRDLKFQHIPQFWTDGSKRDWRKPAPLPTGYGNPVDSPEFLQRWHGAGALIKGGV